MWFFWVFSLVPILAGIALLYFDKRITWKEMLGGSAASLALAGLFQLLASIGMTHDIETWSGLITQTTHYGQWVEEYEQMHTRQVATGVDKDGNTTYTTKIYYTTEHATHYEHWGVDRNFGAIADDPEVDQSFYNQVKYNFGNTIDETGEQSCSHGGHYDGGDRTYYVSHNNTGYKYPVTITKSFENRVKAAPTLFSFVKVPTNISVYPWPENPDWNNSGRVIGTAQNFIHTRNWDILNSDLGPRKKVNLIIVGFPSGYSMDIAKYQEAKWIGGKKNDLVICFAGGSQTEPAEWTCVFGWTEKTLVKLNLQDIFTKNAINDDIIPKVESEVLGNYEKKNWHKFDYITIEPPTWSYWVYLIVMILVQGGLYLWFHFNEFDNDSFNKQVDYKGAEEEVKNKLYRKLNGVKAFFIKPKPALSSSPCLPGPCRKLPPSYHPQKRSGKRNFR